LDAAVAVTLAVLVAVQPFASVPVTVYVQVESTLKAVLSVNPPDHAYVLAPPPVGIAVVLKHVVVGVIDAVTVGNGFTVTVTDVVALQPLASVCVAIYVVLVVGATVCTGPDKEPGIIDQL
jgi:hypothetical protein